MDDSWLLMILVWTPSIGLGLFIVLISIAACFDAKRKATKN